MIPLAHGLPIKWRYEAGVGEECGVSVFTSESTVLGGVGEGGGSVQKGQ